MLQDKEVTEKVGLGKNELVDAIGRLFAKYEIPFGMVNKLLDLQDLHFLLFVVDDSGSMMNETDALDDNGRKQTRWNEAKSRLLKLCEILAYIPCGTVIVSFLNRREEIELNHVGQDPTRFFEEAKLKINQVFKHEPTCNDLTPYLETLERSFNDSRFRGKRVARYLFGDGAPNGGQSAINRIVQLVSSRENPKANPVTFFSCTNKDEDVEWMKDAEGCSELDDFNDEKDEVSKDQGLALPFSEGFYLVCCLVAAMNPNDIDAMDESVPFTRFTLSTLMGIQLDDKNYQHYFDEFIVAQQKRGAGNARDRFKKSYNWRQHYNDFLTQEKEAVSHHYVGDFKRNLQTC
jgi:hypothetical protein